jgi:carbon storage regulator
MQKELIMLVLSRKVGERILISNDIVVTLIEIDGSKVRLGITAPKDMPIHREEVHEAIKEKAAKAA